MECSVSTSRNSWRAAVLCGTPPPPPPHVSFSLSLCPLCISSSPSFLSIPRYQPGCRPGDRPRSGAHEAQTAWLTFSFLSVLSVWGRTPSGGVILCDKLLSHPKKTARAHTCTLDLEKTHENVFLQDFFTHMQRSNHTDILSAHKHWCAQTPEYNICHLCAHVCAFSGCLCSIRAIKGDPWIVRVHLRQCVCVYWLAFNYEQSMRMTPKPDKIWMCECTAVHLHICPCLFASL